MLAPFDLATISSLVAEDELPKAQSLELPENLPSITLRVLPICITSLRSPTREQAAAATLLVRICLRPDMRKAGLLDSMVGWSLSEIRNSSDDSIDIHRSLGFLIFLSKLISSGNHEEIGAHVAGVFYLWHAVYKSETMATVRGSAVARKLNVKIIRSIVLLCLQAPVSGLDTTSVVEETIGHLLEALADGDSPVRMAASKAISVITLQLDPSMAREVIDAILSSLTEDVLWTGSSRNLNAVNPLRWHGLTLTLGHLLYRRTITTDKLPDLVNALLLALNFEQRSATGSSIGTNVRDAANFGIWALSRRYTTAELLAVDTTSVQAIQNSDSKLSVIQMISIQLIESACLDPAGNIRRGSSAALQELIGRHPDTVGHGISLVQIVDYQAVGLRERAMIEVARSAAQLDRIYWESIFTAILDWRGIGAVDSQSRIFAAKSIGLFSSIQSIQRVKEMFRRIEKQLQTLAHRQVEERQGLLVALAELVNATRLRLLPDSKVNSVESSHLDGRDNLRDVSFFFQTWQSSLDLKLTEKDFTSMAMRPELTATAVCDLLEALSKLGYNSFEVDQSGLYNKTSLLLELCLQRPEDTVADKAADVVHHWMNLIPTSEQTTTVESWINYLTASRSSMRKTGYPAALGAAFGDLQDQPILQERIVKTLCDRCSDIVDVEARVVALKSLTRICEALANSDKVHRIGTKVGGLIQEALLRGLNDYTINERGDVGSLVRLEALNTVELIWSHWSSLGPLFQPKDVHAFDDPVMVSVIRLSLEKLDKVRNRAAKCVLAWHRFLCLSGFLPDGVETHTFWYQETSLYNNYFSAFNLLQNTDHPLVGKAIVLGFVSSAGMGSESVLQSSRTALVDQLARLSTHSTDKLSMHSFMTLFTMMFEEDLTDDRMVLPFLDLLAFLLDMRLPQRLAIEQSSRQPFKWLKLLSLVQKSHYKSNNLHKLHLALDVYRGLADIPSLRSEVVKKVGSMLLHPFPKIRVAAAETLFVVMGESGERKEQIKGLDWTQSLKVLKPVVERLKGEIDRI